MFRLRSVLALAVTLAGAAATGAAAAPCAPGQVGVVVHDTAGREVATVCAPPTVQQSVCPPDRVGVVVLVDGRPIGLCVPPVCMLLSLVREPPRELVRDVIGCP